MKASDFRRIALSLAGAEEGSHMGAADFRVGGRIFATLAAERLGYGNLMLTPEVQAGFVAEAPEIFLPVAGGWGRNGATHMRLAAANEDVMLGALRTAWNLRVEMNEKTRSKKTAALKKAAAPKRTAALKKASEASRRVGVQAASTTGKRKAAQKLNAAKGSSE
jgi:hypothetical protein